MANTSTAEIPDGPGEEEAYQLIRDGSPREKARASLVIAALDCEEPTRQYRVSWQFGNACMTFGHEAELSQDSARERVWIGIANRIFSSLVQGDAKFTRSAQHCVTRLQALGVSDPVAFDPKLSSDGAESNHDPVQSDGNVDQENGQTDVGSAPSTSTPTPALSVPDLPTELPEDEDDESIIGEGENLWQLQAGEESCEHALRDCAEVLREQLAKIPSALVSLSAEIDSDVKELAVVLSKCGIPESGHEIRNRAKFARRRAIQSTPDLPESVWRQRWLTSAFWNYALLKSPRGYPDNEPQVLFDILRYVVVIQIARRFSDKSRDILLSCCELVVRVTSELPEPVQEHLRLALQSSVGFYLLTAGPEPALPSTVSYDPRIRSTGGYGSVRDDRSLWPTKLLSQWQSKHDLVPSVAFTLATLAGWSAERARWMVAFALRRTDHSTNPSIAAFWEDQTLRIINGAQSIRIASNPWDPRTPAGIDVDLVSSEPGGRLRVATDALRAMASQLTEADQAITIQGNLFRGRRVPTYMVLNQFGSCGILKIDFADRVRREESNYNEYARKRLHPNFRPSECRTGQFKLFSSLGGRATPSHIDVLRF